MKKLIAFMLCCMMMVGALSAFANDGVMPAYECPCTNTRDYQVDSYDLDECTTVYVYEVICRDCGASLGEYEVEKSHHTWVDEIIDGKPAKACYYCGAVK